jgi:hypothetical protein
VTLVQGEFPGIGSFNIKPQVLLSLMDIGYEDVVWIDSDVVVLGNLSRLFGKLGHKTFVITEEALGGRHNDYSGERTRRWGLKSGKTLPFAINSGIIRATTEHRAILQRWKELLESEEYKASMKLDWNQRPWHMLSDQDALTALLGSSDFADTDVKYLRRGIDIVQYFGFLGYTISERVRNLFGRQPTFVHSQGDKPWTYEWKRSGGLDLKEYLRAIYLDLSPYTMCVIGYQSQVGRDISWTRAHFLVSGILRAVGFWYAPLVGAPLALFWDARELIRRVGHRLERFRN